jgi:Bacterial archaeo-eukaryotic release factor family 10
MSTTWESIEERERHVRGSRTTSVMARAEEQVPEGKTLKEAFADRPFISREDLRRIARQSYERPVISLYLNFSPERLVRADRPVFLSIFSSLRHQALDVRKGYIDSLPHAQRLGVPEDLHEVQEFLEGYEPTGERALLVFKSGTQLNRVMPLPVRVADSLTIDGDAFVEPLEAIVEEQHRLLVLDVALDRTAFSIYELGYEEKLQTVSEDLPREYEDAFRAAKEERHRQTHIIWQFKAAAQLADRLFRERGCDLVALIGEDIVVKEFEEYLSKALHERTFARLRLDRDARPNQRRAAIDGALAEQRKREEETEIGELGFFRGHDRLASGLEMVLGAANLFLMRRLFISSELAVPGYVCRNHHYLSLTAGACPFDNQPLLDSEDVIDELIEFARLHGVDVMIVEQRQDLLAPYQGIAAVLVTAAPVEQLRAVSVTSP